jgi:DnaJ-class molecular chaperone
MAARKTARSPKATTPAEPAKCRTCGGTGEVAVRVLVGRKRQHVGQQSGFCLACFGTGTDTGITPES